MNDSYLTPLMKAWALLEFGGAKLQLGRLS